MKSAGFTLVELIITLVLLGILSVTVVPKMLGSDLVDTYTYRDSTLAALRTMQLRAMQNTDTSNQRCFRIIFNTTDKVIAPPSPRDLDNNSFLCGTAAQPGQNPPDLVIEIENSSDVSFLPIGGFAFLDFDDMGRPKPNTCSGSCVSQNVVVNFSGEDDLSICISSEGLIDDCS